NSQITFFALGVKCGLPSGGFHPAASTSSACAKPSWCSIAARATPGKPIPKSVIKRRLLIALMDSLPGESGNDLLDRFAEIDLEALLTGNFESAWIEAKLMQESRVDVGHVMPVLDGVEAEFVRRAVNDPAFDSAAGHPCREAKRMMVASVS